MWFSPLAGSGIEYDGMLKDAMSNDWRREVSKIDSRVHQDYTFTLHRDFFYFLDINPLSKDLVLIANTDIAGKECDGRSH